VFDTTDVLRYVIVDMFEMYVVMVRGMRHGMLSNRMLCANNAPNQVRYDQRDTPDIVEG